MVDFSLFAERYGIRTMARLGRKVPFREGSSLLPYLITVLCLILTSSFVFAQDTVHTKSLPDAPYVISVHVNMVVLHATVLDRRNALVSGLGEEDFQILEDGALQQMKHFSHEDVPVTVGLVIDNSGSMGHRRSEVIAAALAFARSSNPKDQMFVVNFNEKVSFALPDKTPFTSNVSQLEVALSRVAASGQTALYDAIDAALNHLSKGDCDKKILVIVSDGGDNASKHKLEPVLAKAKRSDAIIYTIGIFDEQDDDRNPRVLKRFAEATGGETFLPKTVKEVVPICERIARDIRSQYTLAYVPTNKSQDGSYRVVQVRAGAAGQSRLSVRTRGGYFAPLVFSSPAATGISHELH
jgi:VWFA-related protein